MKQAYYCYVVPLNENIFLYYNAFTNVFLIMNAKKHSIFQDNTPEKISEIDPDFYAILLEGSFFIEDSFDETTIVEFRKMLRKMDTNQYQIVINTTLDCNLNCWYCYESKIAGSLLTEDIIEIIKKNINQKYEETPYKELKISFFGGEPLINFEAIQNILLYCRDFTTQRNIRLIVDFTTNATLLTEVQLLFLQDYTCHFQITLDGYENRHNKIRFLKENKEKTYKTIVSNIHKIQNYIKDSKIWVRINFDNKTLEKFSEILDDISDLDRKKTFLIIRKIWQYPIEKINKGLILKSIQMAIDKKFHVDNYSLPNNLCFADKLNQVLINYDGKIFKCSTIEHFDDTNAEGTICEETGKVKWDINKLAKKMMARSPEKCRQCKIFPVCLGPCGKNIGRENPSCMYENAGFNMDEYVMYTYKLKNLELELFPEYA